MRSIEDLRTLHPRWEITSHWVPRASAPDVYYILATHGDVRLHATSVSELDLLIQSAEAEDVEYVACDVLRDRPEHVFTVRRVLRAYRTGRMSSPVALAQLRSVSL